MTRSSISFSEPNEKWIQRQIESGETSSKTELVNSLVSRERQRMKAREDLIALLDAAEASGTSTKTTAEIRAEVLAKRGVEL